MKKLTICEKIEGLFLVLPVLALLVAAGARLADAHPTGVADTAKAASEAAIRGCVYRRVNSVTSLNPVGGQTRVRREAEAQAWCRAQAELRS